MKVTGFCALFLLVGAVLMFFNFSSPTFPADLFATNCGDSTTLIAVSRKLKENVSSIKSNSKGDISGVTLDDYHPIDPVPSSKASVKPGPIEHGTPLMPYIPKPSPPLPPGSLNPGGF